jgi:SAM-dependent methyltransferase
MTWKGEGMSEPPDWEEEEERLAARSYAAGDPSGWFDELYAAGASGQVQMPWNRREAHPLLAEWTKRRGYNDAGGRTAVVVGCGLGADAEHLARLGYTTIGFDIAATAIDIARQRNPDSPVRYQRADVLDLPQSWRRAFDLVVEIITVQALPSPLRARAITEVSNLTSPDGALLVIAAVHDPHQPPNPTGPWPLTRKEIDSFAADELIPIDVEQLTNPAQPDQRRWRAEFHRPALQRYLQVDCPDANVLEPRARAQ